MNYTEFIDSKEFRFFSGVELSRYAERTRNGVKNDLPPESIWESILPTLKVADEARRRLGSPLVVTSAYRSPPYNAAVGGVRRSQHLQNTALDLIPRNQSPKKLYDVLWQMRNEGYFVGGLGRYQSFVHVDTRGYNATWG